MKEVVVLVSFTLLFVACNPEKKADTSGPSGSPAAAATSNAIVEDKTVVSPDLLQEKKTIVRKYDLGFVDKYYNFPENRNSESPVLTLEGTQKEFYQKFAGLYVRNPILLSDGAPLNNLQQSEFSWGKDLYFITDFSSVEFNQHDSKFYAPIGDRELEISDLSTFQLPTGWQLLSSAEAPGQQIQKLLDRKKQKLETANISRSLDDQQKVQLVDFYTTVIAALLARDLNGLRQLSTQKSDTDVAFAQLKNLIGEVNEPRITGHGFYVVYNGFQNEDVEAFHAKFDDAVLLEFCFKDDSEFFSLGISRDENGLKVCYAKNGVFDL